MNQQVRCPYCGEDQTIEVLLEGGVNQTYTEDCQVCCRPWQVLVSIDENGDVRVDVERELQ